MAALAAEIRQESPVKGTFNVHVRAIIEEMVSKFSRGSKRSGRGQAFRMRCTMVGRADTGPGRGRRGILEPDTERSATGTGARIDISSSR